MPELPEVETIRRQLAPAVEGRELTALEISDPRWCLPLAPEAVRDTLVAGLAAGGATIDDFRHADGVSGAFQDEFLVHRRRGEPCPECGSEVVKFVAAGRGTYACETCQPRPRARRSRPRARAARA